MWGFKGKFPLVPQPWKYGNMENEVSHIPTFPQLPLNPLDHIISLIELFWGNVVIFPIPALIMVAKLLSITSPVKAFRDSLKFADHIDYLTPKCYTVYVLNRGIGCRDKSRR